MTKYNAVKVEADGFTFDSKAEARRWDELKLMLTANAITRLKVHPKWTISINGMKICDYVADFEYVENGVRVVEDVKSAMTRKLPVYRLKKRMMLAAHGIDVKEVEA